MSVRNGRIPPSAMRVLAAMGRLRQQGKPISLRELMRMLGFASANSLTSPMHVLVGMGLVAKDKGCGDRTGCGTIRLTCRFVPADRLHELKREGPCAPNP